MDFVIRGVLIPNVEGDALVLLVDNGLDNQVIDEQVDTAFTGDSMSKTSEVTKIVEGFLLT